MKDANSTLIQKIYRASLLAVGLMLIVITIAFTPNVMAQGVENSQLTVVAPALNVRTGPGITFAAVGYLLQGDQVTVLDYNADTDWWQVQLPDGATGWISGGPEYVSVSKDTPTDQTETVNNSQLLSRVRGLKR